MHLFEMLKHEHEQVKQVLKQLVESSGRAGKSRSSGLEKLNNLLGPHMKGEEDYFYPILIDEGQQDLGYMAIEEHRAARFVLSDLQKLDASDPRWHARCQVLSELINHHIEEEESEIFEAAEELLDHERQDMIVKQMQKLKQKKKAA